MNARRHSSDIQDSRLLAVLDRYVPPIIARSIVERARREAASGPDVSWTDPNALLDRISVGVRLFAAPEHVSAILRGITDLAADDQEVSPSSHPFTNDGAAGRAVAPSASDDSGPASTLKPSSVRARSEETRVRVEEQPPTRRDLPPPPPSSGAAVPPLPPSRREAPPSRDVPSRETPPREAPSREAAGPLPMRRDTDLPGHATMRTPMEPPPASRGVFPTTSPRSPAPLTPRSHGRGPSIVAIPAIPVIPPPPNAPNMRGRPTPPAGTLPTTERSSSSITQQSMPRTFPGSPALPGSRGAPGGTPAPDRPGAAARGPGSPSPIGQPQDPSVESREVTITLATEHDIPRARQVAREICEALNTRALTQQRLVTIVSELGRNMVLYAGGGKITLRPPIGASRRVIVIAVDQGPGIANLSEIMSGKYKSRSGLGLGIVGTKRLADAFHIDTGRHGTAISVEVVV